MIAIVGDPLTNASIVVLQDVIMKDAPAKTLIKEMASARNVVHTIAIFVHIDPFGDPQFNVPNVEVLIPGL